MVKTKDPLGEWEKPVLVKAGKGMIDPTPLWDEDGKVYLVHAWAGSRAAFNSVITVCEMNAGGTKVISEPVLVFDGNDGVNHTMRGLSFTNVMDITTFGSCRRGGDRLAVGTSFS